MSESGERSPKRQRLNSQSPTTDHETKTPATSFVQPPQTPPPSVHMSPSWSSQQLPGLGMQQDRNFPTPPSTAGFQSQMMARATSSEADSGRQTPVTRPAEEETSAETQEQQQEGSKGDGDVHMEGDDTEHRRTDHERQEAEDVVPPLPGADALYKLCTEPVLPSAPHPSQNLMSLYNLTGIQASVARKDPVTGEGGVKLRKSYEGKVKELGLEGRNKATKGKAELQGLLDPDWSLDMGDGKNMFQHRMEDCMLGEHDENQLLSMLGSALDMRPGHLPKPEHEYWKSTLGLDDSSLAASANKAASPTAAPPAAKSLLTKTAPGAALRGSAPASPKMVAGRPDRAGKKRRYDERSWEGYDAAEDGYDANGERRGSDGGGKRQKRKDFASTTPPFSSGSSSMVGVRSS